MKMKELKNLAQKIAKCELIIQEGNDDKAVQRAQNEMMELCGRAESLEDMTIIDELVQKILKKF